MTRRLIVGISIGLAGLMLTGCPEETEDTDDDSTQASTPAPVTPVEVTPPSEAAAEDGELGRLRARVSELEQQLATCQTAAPAPTVADAVPAVDPAAAGASPAEGTATSGTPTTGTAPDAGTRRARRDRDPTIIDTILGEDGRRRRGRDGDEPLGLPNPARVLLGD